VGVPVGLLITANLKRFKSIATVVWLIGIITAAGFVLYAMGPQFTVIALILNGAGMASSFPVSLALIGMKASSAQQTTQLSAISQGFGYLVAAVGTFLAGFIFDIIHSWSVVLIALAISAVVQSVAGSYAARHRGI
jgi:CP family cyanate transporter-like MFS transporter